MKLFKSRPDHTNLGPVTAPVSESLWNRMKDRNAKPDNPNEKGHIEIILGVAIGAIALGICMYSVPRSIASISNGSDLIPSGDAKGAVENAIHNTVCRSGTFLGMETRLIDLSSESEFRSNFRPVKIVDGPNGTVRFSATYNAWPVFDLTAFSQEVKVPTCD